MSEIFIVFGVVIAVGYEILFFLLEHRDLRFEQANRVRVLLLLLLEASHHFFQVLIVKFEFNLVLRNSLCHTLMCFLKLDSKACMIFS